MNNIESFTEKVFQYIVTQYGKNTLSKIKSDNHKILVNKLLESALNQNDTIEHASNKIIAMLRMNP